MDEHVLVHSPPPLFFSFSTRGSTFFPSLTSSPETTLFDVLRKWLKTEPLAKKILFCAFIQTEAHWADKLLLTPKCEMGRGNVLLCEDSRCFVCLLAKIAFLISLRRICCNDIALDARALLDAKRPFPASLLRESTENAECTKGAVSDHKRGRLNDSLNQVDI